MSGTGETDAKSPIGPQGRLVELASGVDMLVASGWVELSDQLLEDLEELRGRAEAVQLPQPISIADTEFGLLPYVWGKYRFRLEHPFGLVGLRVHGALPTLRIQVRSAFLHAVGPEASWEWFADRLRSWLGPITWKVSRIDLHADFQGWGLTPSDLDDFQCRATTAVTYQSSRNWNTFQFGLRSSKTISGRIYDKTAEVAKKGGDLSTEIWGDRYESGKAVVRVEFELHRAALVEFGIESPEEALACVGALWASLTETWLTHRSPTADQTHSRWPISTIWRTVQRASLRGEAIGLDRVRDSERRADFDRLARGLIGFLASLGVHWRVDDTDAVLARIPIAIRHWETKTGERLPERIERRGRERRYRL